MNKLFLLLCSCMLLLLGCLNEGDVDKIENEDPLLSVEKEVITRVNQERSKKGLASLQTSESLMKSCDIRAKEITTEFSHTRPDGSSCFTVVSESYRAAGENIARGQANAEHVMNSWMNSEGHRNNILGSFTHIGVGCYEHEGTLHWVQLFITLRP